MPLIDLWRQSPGELGRYQIRQIVAIAGDGRLRDNSDCSLELRAYLREAPSQQLCDYVSQCLDESFEGSGFVLQDAINEIGRRLEFGVEDGLYQGRQNRIGFDGIWRSEGGRDLIIEVKTTDQYNARLDAVARYKSELTQSGQVGADSSTLFVVGRQDTGALESQIRGSRYAWDMRVISAASLIKLLQIKEKSAANETIAKIRELLQPFEYTRLDRIVDVIFDTASDVEQQTDLEREVELTTEGVEEELQAASEGRQQVRTDPALMSAMKERILRTYSGQLGVKLIKRRPALFESLDGTKRVGISLSKRYDNRHQNYWYAYHPAWDQFLEGAPHATHILGCMDRNEAFALPRQFLHQRLPLLNTTVRNGFHYWHVGLVENQNHSVSLILNNGERFDLSIYSLPLID